MILQIVLYVLAAIGLLLLVMLALAMTRPDRFRIARQATINAPRERVFALIQDFHRWRDWSPWENIDPNLERIYSGPERGVGAAYEWKGNKNVGRGRMEVREADVAGKVLINLNF